MTQTKSVLHSGSGQLLVACSLQIVLSLHGWALDQAGELLVDADRDDDAAVRSFTRGFVLKTRSALKGMGHAERIDALQMNEEDADFL